MIYTIYLDRNDELLCDFKVRLVSKLKCEQIRVDFNNKRYAYYKFKKDSQGIITIIWLDNPKSSCTRYLMPFDPKKVTLL